MTFGDGSLAGKRPATLAELDLPRRKDYLPSPGDWRNEVLYFLLPDARPSTVGEARRWDRWAESGAQRWQGRTLAGIRGKLGYLESLGVTALWIGREYRPMSK